MTAPDPTAEEAQAERLSVGTWLGFAAMCLGMFMAVLDIQVVATSLPAIRTALGIADDRMSWIQTAYLIAEIIAIPLTGLLTRAISMRRLFAAAVGVFTLASIGCAASTGFATLIAGRVVQGFSGGMLIPLVFSAVFLLFPLRFQGVATTLAGMLAVLAPTVGPIVGGWITETGSWHWLFLVNVVPGILAFLLGLATLRREAGHPTLLRSLDVGGLALLALSLASLQIGLKQAPDDGWLSAPVLGLLGASLLAGAWFVARMLGAGTPIVQLRTFRDRGFAVGCGLSFILGMGLYGSVYLMPVFLAFMREHGPLEIGIVMLVTGVTQLLTAPLAVALEQRADARLLTLGGFLLFGAGLAMSGFATRQTDFDGMFWPQVVRGGAIMFCLLPPTRLALGGLLPEAVPDASGVFNLMRNLGGAIGIALIDTVIYGRSPVIAEALAQRLVDSDAKAFVIVGLPLDRLKDAATLANDPDIQDKVLPLIQKAALVEAIDEAWIMLAAITFAGCALTLLAPRGAASGKPMPGH
ncbi:DHA2 family efflux MFS transporter permease subunit [Jiella sonneratiae]|uniref:DHA2 family efflux MFS transporter permease subunit n=1 Tax=Jiella sonneratiae TaxID=2816856 RepID=A0ABS3J7U6_9HYPH|nr:DHA2 family efflux MFS transporter permease subunit [Jiella sonneratiae]MBO0905727.1 DHA2 family efflux MFS transporter permease subunit [Jiella sonneratiae]